MSNYLPQNVTESDSRAPWNQPQEPERLSLGSDCCGDIVLNSYCMCCRNICIEEFESDRELARRIAVEREEDEANWLEAKLDAMMD